MLDPELGRGHWVIGYSQEDIDKYVLGGTAAEFHKKHSGANGLLEDMLKSKVTKEECTDGLLALIKQHCPQAKTCPLVSIP